MSGMVLGLALAMQVAADTVVVALPGGDRMLTTVEEVRLGSLDGPEEATFGWFDNIAVAPDGTVFVPDVQIPAIRIFDPEGHYVADLGREGQGPGEYQAIRGIDVLSDGRVAVWHEMGDITVFDDEYRFVRRFNVGLQSLVGGPGPGLVADLEGGLFVRTMASRPVQGDPVIRYAWVRATAGGEVVDSVVPADRDLDGSPFAFRGETVTTPSPVEYMVSGRTTTYAIHRPLADGRTVRIERPWQPIPLEGEERAQWEAYIDAVEERREDDFPDMHEAKPAWRELGVGYDGRIWVRRYSEAAHVPGYESVGARGPAQLPNVDWLEPARYDVLDPRGAYLGTVDLPPEATLLRARGPWLWALEQGSFDERYVVRYRIDELTAGDDGAVR
jgi:hypothetical protein